MARQGKIARLPHRLRKQVNTRLRDGEAARKLLAWLNAQPDAIAVWDAEFEGVPASPQNLSEWRLGGFKEYLRERDKLDAITTLSDYALEVAERSGASLADGAAAIIAGQIVKSFETLADTEESGLSLDKAAFAVAALRTGDHAKEKHQLAEKKHLLAEKRTDLDREKFERLTCEAVYKAGKSKEIQAILGSGETKAVQLDLIHEQLFGKAPAK